MREEFVDWMDRRLEDMISRLDYLHIDKEVLRYLREQRATEEQITMMSFGVPCRCFENMRTYSSETRGVRPSLRF